jgi:hypothetical protein
MEETDKFMHIGIKAEIARLNKEITELINKRESIKRLCKHINVEKIAKSSTGNYDPSCDRFWYECTCSDCLEYWTEDQ